MNNPNLECEDITKTTEMKLNEEISSDITKKWERQCPRCNQLILYKTEKQLYFGNRNNSFCHKCYGYKKQKITAISVIVDGVEKWKRYCPNCKCEIIHKTKRWCNKSIRCDQVCMNCQKKLFVVNDDKIRNCIKCNKKLKYQYHYQKIRADNGGGMCRSCTLKNRNMSDGWRLKARLSVINHIINKNGGISAQYNINACKFIDELNKQNGWKLQHALNGGEHYISELGYFLDAYDKEKNIVFEYDEKHHYYKNGILKEKDVKRMGNIKLFLGCEFIRYNEKLNEIRKY